MYEAIRNLLRSSEFSVMETVEVPGRPAQYEKVPSFLFDSEVGDYLNRWSRGVGSEQPGIWAHQAQALERLGRGENVVVSTGTASGKSLVFRALALHKILLDPSSKVVVFYPLRALVADQLRGWREMCRGLGFEEDVVGRIDGSVSTSDRDDILQQSRILIMTPDVCQAWLMSRLAMPAIKGFIGSLSTLVMDEAHTLEGVFGSNFAFLIRRLIAARNHVLRGETRVTPLQLVAATATISNPGEHMKKLTGAEFTAIDHKVDGAQRYERIVAHVASPEGEELKIAKDLHHWAITKGQDGAFITFMDSRKGVEALATATQKGLEELLDDPAVASYRGGFTSSDRQSIERQLRSGDLKGVVSTSALELGIDFPNLRVGFSVDLPPTRKAYRQRLGRVGRNGPGAFVVIGPPNMFQRYGTSLREYHDMSVEPSYLYLDNRFMQFAHGRCLADEREALAASASLPTHVDWPSGFSDTYAAAKPGGSRPTEFDAIAELGGDTPQLNYPLRNVGETSFDIKLHENLGKLGDATQSQALRECYPGAAYFHMMKPYEVTSWQTGAFIPFIRVKHGIPGRSTKPRITTWISAEITAAGLIEGNLLKGDNGFLAECQMQITEQVNGYTDGKTGEFRSYRELQQHNPNMKARSRNFRTSGVVLCVEADWFKCATVKTVVSDRLREVFTHEYSVLPQDVGSAATHITVRDSDGRAWRGGCIAIFDETYGSLRLTENLYVEFKSILKRLSVAASTEDDIDESVVARIYKEVSGFSHQRPLRGTDMREHPSGYEQVFSKGSRVCYRLQGSIATDVEVIQPTLIDGRLMYQVKAYTRRGEPPLLDWIPASSVEPTADTDAWEYKWWNRETQTYEDPPDGDES